MAAQETATFRGQRLPFGLLIHYSPDDYERRRFIEQKGLTDDEDIAAALNLKNQPLHRVRLLRLMPWYQEPLSESIPDSADLAEILTDNSKFEAICDFMEQELTEREYKVLYLRFGFFDDIQRTQAEVGDIFNCTRERIRQIEAKAIRKLRHSSRSSKLMSILYG